MCTHLYPPTCFAKTMEEQSGIVQKPGVGAARLLGSCCRSLLSRFGFAIFETVDEVGSALPSAELHDGEKTSPSSPTATPYGINNKEELGVPAYAHILR